MTSTLGFLLALSFTWPWATPGFLILPLVVWAYVRSLRAKAARLAALKAQGFVPVSSVGRLNHSKRRHLPFILYFLGLAMLLFGLLRPSTEITTVKREGTLILAFDVSDSMRADDIEPTRLDAAKAAAITLVSQQPSSIRVGIVVFSEGGVVTLRPTEDRTEITSAIGRLSTGGGTSIGQGIYQALTAISGKQLTIDLEALADESQEIDVGYFGSASVVLFSDGENTGEPDPLEMAKVASLAGVKLYPVGLGSEEGTVIELDGLKVATKLDTALLQQLAETTDGRYTAAPDAETLKSVYDSIDLKWESRKEFTEVTGWFAAAAAAALVLGSVLSIFLLGRVV
jgi:Ca-activated chloride channel homolog